MNGYSILVVEDNLLVGMGLKQILHDEGYRTVLAENGREARQRLAEDSFDIVLLDMMLPDANGRDLLEEWHQAYPELLIVFITGHATVEMAVECLKAGAHDFLTKPVERPMLVKTLSNAVQHRQLTQKVELLSELSQRMTDTAVMGEVIARDPVTQEVLDMASRIAVNDFSSILITGESGTGKGLLARTIHKLSKRAQQPFVELNCAAMPAHLVESELFGHAKGSFTDAKTDKIGLFEMADKGTLFLDEIGDMDVSLQAKLLKAMEEQRFRRIGGTKEIQVDVAIVAATNQNVEGYIRDGQFRADLYYRLNVLPLHLPPLRERRGDIDQLSRHFLMGFSRKLGKRIDGFTAEVNQALLDYDWPGNVRELRNVIERGCILTRDPIIGDIGLLFPHRAGKPAAPPRQPVTTDAPAALPPMTLEAAERQVIESAMKEANGNRNEAARLLGIHRTTLYKKLDAYKIDG